MNKKAVSNQALAILVILALAVSICGTLVSLNKLKTFEVTGFATAIGSVNATITGITTITLRINGVNFTNEAAGNTNDTTDGLPLPFNLSNDGNICVNVTIGRDTNNAWFTGTMDDGGTTTNSNNTKMKARCPGTYNCRGAATVTTFTNLTTSARLVIESLNYTSGNNSGLIDIRIHVPTDELAGVKYMNVTFSSSDSGLTGCTAI